MLVTMRLASNIITSKFFEKVILLRLSYPSSTSTDPVTSTIGGSANCNGLQSSGNFKRSGRRSCTTSQDELSEFCKTHSLPPPEYTLLVSSPVNMMAPPFNSPDQAPPSHPTRPLPRRPHQRCHSTINISSQSLTLAEIPSLVPQQSETYGQDDTLNDQNQFQSHRRSNSSSIGGGMNDLSSHHYHYYYQRMYTCLITISISQSQQQLRFISPRGVEFEDRNQAREAAAALALKKMKKDMVFRDSSLNSFLSTAAAAVSSSTSAISSDTSSQLMILGNINSCV